MSIRVTLSRHPFASTQGAKIPMIPQLVYRRRNRWHDANPNNTIR
jgi:hypothetical protein